MKTICVCLFVLLLWLALPAAAQQPPTETVQEMLEQGSTAVVLDELLQFYTFDDPRGDGWDIFDQSDARFFVRDGVYRVQVDTDEFSWWGSDNRSYDDVVIQVETGQFAKTFGNSHGIICRLSNQGDGYYFLVINNSEYALLSAGEEGFTFLAERTLTDVIGRGQAINTLTAVCVGDYLAFYINGQLVAELRDSTHTSGGAGVTVSSADGQPVDLTFDDYAIWAASSAGGVAAARPDTLTEHGGEWRDAVAELEALGLIASGGSLVFRENYAFFTGQGSWFTPLARNNPAADFVMAGELSFRVGSSTQAEICTLSSRIVLNAQGLAVNYIDVGLDNQGRVVVVDVFDQNQPARRASVGIAPLDLSGAHHFLILVQDASLSVYLDGQLVLQDFEVVKRSGMWGIGLEGAGPNARCEGRNIWVYEAIPFTPGLCEISSSGPVNRRSGPGTSFAQAGQLTAGQILLADGRFTGADGLTWWRLEDGTWVREDVVNARGDCRNLPVVSG